MFVALPRKARGEAHQVCSAGLAMQAWLSLRCCQRSAAAKIIRAFSQSRSTVRVVTFNVSAISFSL
jgi:hypothetical protein